MNKFLFIILIILVTGCAGETQLIPQVTTAETTEPEINLDATVEAMVDAKLKDLIPTPTPEILIKGGSGKLKVKEDEEVEVEVKIVIQTPTPEPTPEPTPDPQPETLVYSGSEDYSDLSEADLDAVAAEVIKASFAAVALEVAEPYLDGMDDLISQLAGDFGGYFFGRGLSSADALDLDMALVISGSDSGSETYAGTCFFFFT